MTDPEATGEQNPALEKMVRFNHLADLYGALLTDRQRRLAEKRFQEDLSFGEIAEEEGVSRQAVHDGVRQALQALDKFESKLGLARRQTEARERENARIDLAVEKLVRIRKRLETSLESTGLKMEVTEAVLEVISTLKDQ